MTKNQLLRLMGEEGRIAERRNEGGREVWRVKNAEGIWIPCATALRELKKRGWIWAHYPSGGGSAGLNSEGRIAYTQLTGKTAT